MNLQEAFGTSSIHKGQVIIDEVMISAALPQKGAPSRVGTDGRQDTTAKIEAVENGFRDGKARVRIGSRLLNGDSQGPLMGLCRSQGQLARGGKYEDSPQFHQLYTRGRFYI